MGTSAAAAALSGGISGGLSCGLTTGILGGGAVATFVTQDATSLAFLPQSATEYSNFISRTTGGLADLTGLVSVPDLMIPNWGVLSGDLTDVIGALTFTASGTNQIYNSSVAGWSSGFVRWINAATGAFTSTDTSLPAINTTSMAIMILANFPSAPTATRGIIGAGTTATIQGQMTLTPRFVGADGANTATSAADPTGSTVNPLLFVHNVTSPTACGLYTIAEALTYTKGAGTGKKLRFGGSDAVTTSPPMFICWACAWYGAKAEAFSTSSTAKALFVKQGNNTLWSPPWS